MSSLNSMNGYGAIVRKEALHLLRDPTTLVIALLIPIIQLTLFGFAIDFDVRHIKTAVVDMDRSRESRAYLDSLRNTQYLDMVLFPTSVDEAEAAMRRGAVNVTLLIPPDFARRSVPGDRPQVGVLIDGSDNQVATRARLAIMTSGSSAASTTASGSRSPAPGGVDARINMVYNPQMRSQVFMIPGLIGVILQLVTVTLTSFSLVRERETGTLEQLMVSPVGKLGLMLGKLTPYAALAFIEMGMVLALGYLVFEVRVAGSVALLMLLSLPFIVAALSMGLLISTVARNQAQALQLTLLVTLPSILMTGFVFPRETMPGVLYLASDVFPVTWFLIILRGIVVRGAGLADLWSSLMALLLITVILLSVSLARFRKDVG